MADVTFQLLDGRQATEHGPELAALHAEVYRDPPYNHDADPSLFADRFRVQRRQPGFVLAEARVGGYLVGYAAGMPLRSSTSWWKNKRPAISPSRAAIPPPTAFWPRFLSATQTFWGPATS